MCLFACFSQLDHCDLCNVSPILAHKFCAQLLLTSPELKIWVLLTQNDITAEELTKRLDHFWHHPKPETTFSAPNLPLTEQTRVTVTQHLLRDPKTLPRSLPFSAAFGGILRCPEEPCLRGTTHLPLAAGKWGARVQRCPSKQKNFTGCPDEGKSGYMTEFPAPPSQSRKSEIKSSLWFQHHHWSQDYS